jgi:single-stranded-DNA-specific exonuclease
MQPVWTYREEPDAEKIRELSSGLGVRPLVATLLWQRGVRSTADGKTFLDPSMDDLIDCFRLEGMNVAVARILRALEEGEPIGLFGDFDVDGVTGAALLYRFFRRVGSPPVWRLPRRLDEGYGLSRAAIDEFAERGVKLLVTVDCGITAVEEVRYAGERGIECIVTDHHEPKGTLPNALAVVDPKRTECTYPFKHLAGVGIAWKLADGLTRKGVGTREELLTDLDLVAIGTIADVAPLVGENRIFARHGLLRLAQTNKIGLRHLLDLSGFSGRKVDYVSVAFGLGPRINAVGRLGEATEAFRLVTTESDHVALELARKLDSANKRRQALDGRILDECLERLREEEEEVAGIVLESEEWHPGVIGIVASRLKEMYGCPAALIALKEGMGRGSARSVPGFPLHDALAECSDLLVRHGGHALAAGFTVAEEKIAEFRERFRALFQEAREGVAPAGSLTVDGELDLRECTGELLTDLRLLEPFGPGNRKPIFVARAVAAPGGFRPVGKNHLKFAARKNGVTLEAIAFQVGHEKAELWGSYDRLDVAFALEENRWGGESRLQLNVKGIRPAE